MAGTGERSTGHPSLLLLVAAVSLSAGMSFAEEAGPRQRPGRLELTVDTDRRIGTCYRFWTVNVFTSQHQFIEKHFGFLMRRDKPLMKYANCVRLLGGRSDGRNRWYLGVDDRGNVKTDFSGLVKYLRGIIALGYTPRIVLDNVPTEMSSGKGMNKYGNTNPPADYGLWHQYITALVETLVREFGAERAGAWRYRVGTEPDRLPECEHLAQPRDPRLVETASCDQGRRRARLPSGPVEEAPRLAKVRRVLPGLELEAVVADRAEAAEEGIRLGAVRRRLRER
ncbi:MAG: GH39 family glycosyl hydrolase [Planctomycetota bacterium]